MIKRVFYGGHVLVTTVQRVRVRMVFSCLCFNLVQLASLGVGRSVGHRSFTGDGVGMCLVWGLRVGL